MKQKLKEGDTIAPIEAVDAQGKDFSLSKIGSLYALVCFLRYAGCPFCNLALHRLTMEHPMLRKSQCEIVAFVQSDAAQIQKNVYDRHAVKPTFTIIADKQKQYYDRFSVSPNVATAARMIRDVPQWLHAVRQHGFKQKAVDGNLLMAPATFLVHVPSMKILRADYQSNLFEHETFAPIYEDISTFRT